MAFESLLKNQSRVVKLFQNSMKKDRLVQTYLFEGPKGTNKVDAAYYFGAMIFCSNENPPCLQCENCLKAINHNHYDIFYIEPINEMIKKEQIVALEHEFSYTSLSEGKRVFIINGIDKCNVQSANRLLKFLEEGSQNNYGILITENINNVLPTIRSRSQIVSFKEISKDEVANILINQGFDEDISKIVSSITNDVEEAKEIISKGQIIDLIELVKKIGLAPLNEEDPYLVFIDGGEFILKEGQKVQEMFLNLLVTLLNDELMLLLDQLESITFKDEMTLISMKLKLDVNEVMNKIETVLKYKDRIRYNVNLDLMYAQMFIELGGK